MIAAIDAMGLKSNAEIFALFEHMENCADLCDLKFIREELIRRLYGAADKRKANCYCGKNSPKVFGKVGRIIPAVMNIDTDDCLILPWIYIGWRARDCHLPIIEIFEIPLFGFDNNILFSQASIKAKLRGFADLVVLPKDKKIDPGNAAAVVDSNLVWEARRSALLEYLSKYSDFHTAYLSIFKFDKDKFGKKIQHYDQLSPSSAQAFEFHQKRVIPVWENEDLNFFVAYSYAVTRRNSQAFF